MQDINGFGKALFSVMDVGVHGHLFCSALQFQASSNVLRVKYGMLESKKK